MENLRILVTGGAGFMGSWVVDELVTRGHIVTAVDNMLGGQKENINKNCTFIEADLRNKEQVFELVKDQDLIFHLAAYAAEGQSFFSPIEINDVNLRPINNLLVAAVNNNVQRIVFTSSMAVYGNQSPPFNENMLRSPVDPYGAAKSYCELMLEIFRSSFNLPYVIIRPHNVYGPRQNIADPYRNVLGIWMNRILRGLPPIIYGDGKQTRAFSFIEDVTPAIVNAGFSNKAKNQIINLGSDEVVSIEAACKTVLSVMGCKFEPIYADERPGEVKYAYCTVDKSYNLLDYKTNNPLRDGLVKMNLWAKNFGAKQLVYKIPLEITKNVPKVWLEKLL